MSRLRAIRSPDEVLPEHCGTPIGDLIAYHNFGQPFESYTQARLLIGMCMDSRKHLRIPDNFAFIIRSGGANLRYADFQVSYAVAVGGVRAIALLGHNNCGMANLMSRRQQYIDGMVENAGWSRERASEQFMAYAPMFEIGNEIEFVLSEAARLTRSYPKVLVAPFLYRVEDNLIYAIEA